MSRFALSPGKRKPEDTYIALQGRKMGETEKAVRFLVLETPDGSIPKEKQKGIWLPLSQIKSITTAAPGSDDPDVVTCKEWIWKAKIGDTWAGINPAVAPASLNKADADFLDNQDNFEDDFDDNGPPF